MILPPRILSTLRIVSLLSLVFGWAIHEQPACAYTLAETRGIGARAISMGGAFTGVADDESALYYNPAGMIQVDGHRAHMEYMLVFPRVYLQRGSGPKEVYLDKTIEAPVLGIILDISRRWKFSRKVRVGFISCFSDNFKVAGKMRYGTFYDPYYPLYGDSSADQMLSAWVNGAVEIFPWLFVGGGFTFGTNGSNVDLRMALDPSTFDLVVTRSKVTWQMTTEIQPMFGFLVKPLARLRIGFVFRKGMKLLFNNGINIPASIVVDSEIVPFPIPINVPVHSHYRPLQYALGASYKLKDNLLLAFDVTYYDWRQYKDEAERFLDPPMKAVWVPRFGIEYFPTAHLALRTGYGYKPSPLKQQRGTWVNYADNDVHAFSCGAGYFWNPFGLFKRPAEFALFYQFSYLVPRTFQNVHQGGPELRSSGYSQSFGCGVSLTH